MGKIPQVPFCSGTPGRSDWAQIFLTGLFTLFQSAVFDYRIVASTSPSRIEANAGLLRSLIKGIFDPYVL